MLFIRSMLFNIAFYFLTALLVIACMFTLPLPQRYVVLIGRIWGQVMTRVFSIVVGGSYEVRGADLLPKDQSFILAAKHMSAYETFALIPLVNNPLFILKRELLWIPFFGWAVAKGDMIPIDRGSRKKALAIMLKHAKEKMKANRQLIIFPEGTRRPVDGEPRYKYGISHAYAALDVPCYPVALNTGLFWPRRTFMRYPGKVIVEVLPPIPPGLPRDEFFEKISNTIETNSQRLISEARDGNPHLPPARVNQSGPQSDQ